MCNGYASEIEAGRVKAAMEETKNVPPFSYTGGHIPNDAVPTPHIKIRERGLVVRRPGGRLAHTKRLISKATASVLKGPSAGEA